MTVTDEAARPVAEPRTDQTESDQPPIDQELLDEAQRQLNGVTPNEAINAALELLCQTKRAQRRQAMEELQRMSAEGMFDYSKLPPKKVSE
ncbi:MAG TPA: hypothetical protein VL738_12285 [Dactylosporangium sp.]|jgi:hypothetical protein|nr:hypothetical protein [Dactylosporangium sp.]